MVPCPCNFLCARALYLPISAFYGKQGRCTWKSSTLGTACFGQRPHRRGCTVSGAVSVGQARVQPTGGPKIRRKACEAASGPFSNQPLLLSFAVFVRLFWGGCLAQRSSGSLSLLVWLMNSYASDACQPAQSITSMQRLWPVDVHSSHWPCSRTKQGNVQLT